MLYMNDSHLKELNISWDKSFETIGAAIECLANNDFSQPIKPYLRYGDLQNRIIAMPAWVGGQVNRAGIKWIASFPRNIDIGKPRAHAITVLNNAETGEPVAIFNAPFLSIHRTASVSGFVIKQFEAVRHLARPVIGIIGWGPIGRHHFEMCSKIFDGRLDSILLYDLKGIDSSSIQGQSKSITKVAFGWQEVYEKADILITCTVSSAPYINGSPKPGSLHLNVSLRDYTTEVFEYFKSSIIVDNWEEVCREKTDIEIFHQKCGLQKESTFSIVDIANGCITKFAATIPIMFNPMGMAIFDIAMAECFLTEGLHRGIGVNPDAVMAV